MNHGPRAGEAGPGQPPGAVPPGVPSVFVRLMVGFGVMVPVGLAPLLGKAKVPGFAPLLELFPPSMQWWLIPLSSLLMGLTCVAVTFYMNIRLTQRIDAIFLRFLKIAGVSILCVIVPYTLFVVSVRLMPENVRVAVVTGWSRCADCAALSDLECVKRLSLNEASIDACYDGPSRRIITLVLALAYLSTLTSFGALVGVLMMQKGGAWPHVPAPVLPEPELTDRVR